jgi:hypothetical protein
VGSTEKRSWLARHAVWLVPTIALAAMAGFAGVTVYGVYFFFGLVKSCGACEEAIARAKAHPAVQAALGGSVEDGLLVTGSVSINNSSGHANLQVPLSGPTRKATLRVVASKSGGTWRFSLLVVEVDGTGERIDLLAGVPAPSEVEGPAEALPVPGR